MCFNKACLMIYLNSKNKTIFRINTRVSSYKIGETTSMGWFVLDKQYYLEEKKMFVNKKTMIDYEEKKQKEDFKRRKKREKKVKLVEMIHEILK